MNLVALFACQILQLEAEYNLESVNAPLGAVSRHHWAQLFCSEFDHPAHSAGRDFLLDGLS
jgi:hypothetical protein